MNKIDNLGTITWAFVVSTDVQRGDCSGCNWESTYEYYFLSEEQAKKFNVSNGNNEIKKIKIILDHNMSFIYFTDAHEKYKVTHYFQDFDYILHGQHNKLKKIGVSDSDLLIFDGMNQSQKDFVIKIIDKMRKDC